MESIELYTKFICSILRECLEFFGEGWIADRLIAFMVAICRDCWQLAAEPLKYTNGKQAVGGITETKTKTDILTERTFQRIITCAVFQRNRCKHGMFC